MSQLSPDSLLKSPPIRTALVPFYLRIEMHHSFCLPPCTPAPVAPSPGLQSSEQFPGVPQHWADGGEVHCGGQDQGGQHPWARPSHWVLQTSPVQQCSRRDAACSGVQCTRDGGAHQGQWLLRGEGQSITYTGDSRVVYMHTWIQFHSTILNSYSNAQLTYSSF